MANESAEGAMRLTIDGHKYSLEPDDLELGEVELLEETLDASLSDIDFGRAKAMRVLVYLMIHRERPEFTLEDAGKLKLSALNEPEANGNGNGKPKAAAKRPTRAAASGS